VIGNDEVTAGVAYAAGLYMH